MSAGLVIIKKELNGQPFSNTYCVMVGDDSVPLTEADLTAMVDIGTLGADQTVAVSPKIINALVDFEMAMMVEQVQFTNVYVTDGRNMTEGGDPQTIFLSKNLSIHGNNGPVADDIIAPGNVTLMVARVPGGFSARQGRLFLRGVLTDSEVSYKGPKLVGWTSNEVQGQYITAFNSRLTSTGLINHLAGGSAAAGGVLAIPHYQKESDPATPQDGNLIGATPVASLQVVRPTARQVGRGRREKP
jgi:hypothetical protein